VSNRITRDQLYMTIANLYSQRSTCLRGQVGVIIVNHPHILSGGYNGAPSGQPHCIDEGCLLDNRGRCIRCIHAEANAIAFAAQIGVSLKGSTLYTTLSPCVPCAQLIINAGIIRVVYESAYHDVAGITQLNICGVDTVFYPTSNLCNVFNRSTYAHS